VVTSGIPGFGMAVVVRVQRHMCYECDKTWPEQPALLVAPKGGAVGRLGKGSAGGSTRIGFWTSSRVC
jgi:hypothetical protein